MPGQRERIEEIVLRSAKYVTGWDHITLDMTMETADIDSLERIDLIMDISDTLGIYIPEEIWDHPDKKPMEMTLTDLVDRVLIYT